MTTLKSINQSIEDGNDDLEALNKNFAKYFELQKRNRLDDLEDRRESKRKGGAPATVAAAVAAGSSSEDTKSGFKLPKLLTGLAAAIAAFMAARSAFGDPGTDRPIKPGNIKFSNRRVPKVDSVLSRANNKLAKLRIANAKIALIAEQEKLARRKKLQYNARRLITKPIGSFPGALDEPETIRQRNLAQQRANQRAQIRADAARFRANSNKPTTNFKPFTPGYKPQIMFPNAQTATVQGNLTRMSRPATVMSNSGKIYPVDSPEGRRVIKMTQTYQDSVKNMRGNGQMNQKINSPKVSPFSRFSTSGNVTNTKVGGSGRFTGINPAQGFKAISSTPTAVQRLRTRLLGSTTAGANAFNSAVKGVSGKIMTFTSATGNWARDFKDLMAYRRGATLPKWAQLCTKMAGWMARKVIGAYIAYQWFYVMTDPKTTKQQKIVLSGGLLAALGGAVIGTMVGAFIGTLAIPIPLVGTLLGGALGGYLAAKKGQEIGEFIAREIMGIEHPPAVLADMTEFKAMVDAQTSRFDSINADRDRMVRNPLPSGVRPTGPGGIAIGGAGGDAMSVGAGFGGFTPGGITGTGFSGFGSTAGENNANIGAGLTGSHFTALGGKITSARQKQLADANFRMMMASGNFGNPNNGGFFNMEGNNSGNNSNNVTTHTHTSSGIRSIDDNPRTGYESGQDFRQSNARYIR